MASDWVLQKDVPTGGRETLHEIPRTGELSSSVLADRAHVVHEQARDLHDGTGELRRATALNDLRTRQRKHAVRSPMDVLEDLSDRGFAWRDVARMMGVSVPALQKWRRGDGMTAENRSKLARIAGLIEMLEQRFVNEPASWLEMHVDTGVALTPLDLVAAGRDDLVLELATEAETGARESIYSEYDPDWRTNLVDTAFESFVAADGMMSIRPRR